MWTEILLATVRHGIGALGGGLARTGYLTGDEVQQAVGALGVLASVGWSLYRKMKRARAASTGR